MNGDIMFEKAGPAGKESGQSKPNIYLIKIKNGKVVLQHVSSDVLRSRELGSR